MEGIDPHKRRPQGSGPADDRHQVGKIPHAPVGPAPQGIERQVETPGPAALLQPGRRIRLGRRRDQPGPAGFLPAAAPHFQGQIVIPQLQVGGQRQRHRDPEPSRDRLALQPPGRFKPPLPPVALARFADHLPEDVHRGRGLRPGGPDPHRRPGQSRRRFDELHRLQQSAPGTQTPPGDLPVQALRVFPGHAHGAEQVPVGGLGGAVAAAKIVPVLRGNAAQAAQGRNFFGDVLPGHQPDPLPGSWVIMPIGKISGRKEESPHPVRSYPLILMIQPGRARAF